MQNFPSDLQKHRPRKRFGQNFLYDRLIVSQILGAINPRPQDHLVEIGPGTGALTESLLSQCTWLDVVELDRDLVAGLKARFAGVGHLKIHGMDALKLDLTALRIGDEKMRLIGNLPYNISTPLIFHLLEFAAVIQDMHFMLQKEVVDRICAEPGSKVFGRLSVMVQLHYRTEKLFEVPPECFRPSPKVHSAVLRLIPDPATQALVIDRNHLLSLIRQAFSQRRKTLRNTLKARFSAHEIAAAGIDPGTRAESLAVSDYIRLSNYLSRNESE